MFHKIPASKKSLANRKLIFGIGINDSDYITDTVINGKREVCPAYRKWKGIMERCYSSKYHEKRPTYRECSVSDEWVLFSNFESWFYDNLVDGYELDKDLSVVGNKIYSSETCLFVPRAINLLITGNVSNTGNYPTGVYLMKSCGKFNAQVSCDGINKYLGIFNTPEEARTAYVKAKNEEINIKCKQYPEFSKYLINHLL